MLVSIMLEMNDASWHKKNVGDDMVRLKEGFWGKFVEKMSWKNTKKKKKTVSTPARRNEKGQIFDKKRYQHQVEDECSKIVCKFNVWTDYIVEDRT